MSSRTKIIVSVLVGAAVLGLGYIFFFNNNGDSTAVGEAGAPTSAAEATFLNLASKLEPISFDTSIFSDPRFAAFVDIHTAIVPEPQGRKDPFAAVPGITTSVGQ